MNLSVGIKRMKGALFGGSRDTKLDEAQADEWGDYQEPPVIASSSNLALFLDFDGVLHRGNSGTLRHLPMIEQLMGEFPDVGVVIISDWRLGDTLEGLRGYFSPGVREQVIGKTGDRVPCSIQRQREVEDFVHGAGIHHYLVLDDDRDNYARSFQPVYCPDPGEGLTQDDMQYIRAHLQRW